MHLDDAVATALERHTTSEGVYNQGIKALAHSLRLVCTSCPPARAKTPARPRQMPAVPHEAPPARAKHPPARAKCP